MDHPHPATPARHILLITTGGTIACRDLGNGLVPVLGPEELLHFVPDMTARCRVTVLPLFRLDSTDMTPTEWQALAHMIRSRYADYDGFVITHGTDTLAYAAATLSCLLRHSAKPIVLTGSQLPMGTPGSDAPINLSNAFTWALHDTACGVHIVFAGRVIRGLRARKRHTTALDAFESVNCSDTARIVGETVTLLAPTVSAAPSAPLPDGIDDPIYDPICDPISDPDEALDTRLALVHLTPGMMPDILWHMSQGLRAMIIEGVGIGGIPDALTAVLTRVASAGIKLILTSQVPYGACDFTVYRVGRRICEACGSGATGASSSAVVTTRDIPSEAAFAATMWALHAADVTGQDFGSLFASIVRDADLAADGRR